MNIHSVLGDIASPPSLRVPVLDVIKASMPEEKKLKNYKTIVSFHKNLFLLTNVSKLYFCLSNVLEFMPNNCKGNK